MDFNLYQEKAHDTANYPSGTIGKDNFKFEVKKCIK